MRVARELYFDFLDVGQCVYSVTDNDYEFKITRLDPTDTYVRIVR
jgi:hypothetical protein